MFSLSPPAIITNYPFLAPISPPDTGASIEKHFFFSASFEMLIASYGDEVV